MKQGKFEAKRIKGQMVKPLALLVALALVVGIGAGGTMAWLLDKTESIQNTFTAGDVSITLEETTTDYKMVPGTAIAKDPKVTVTDTSEDCYVFVELAESENFDSFMTYAVAEGWTQGTGDGVPANVYYRTVKATDTTRTFSVLSGDAVSVQATVTKDALQAVATANQPTLTVTAYACQLAKTSTESFTVGEAWTQVRGLNN